MANNVSSTANGGDGVQCTTLYGIANCTPTGYSKLSTYYWGGGGGAFGGSVGKGGKGGGAGVPPTFTGDTNGINLCPTPLASTGQYGAPNTGGGAGGVRDYNAGQTAGGIGGSGIVILAIPV